VADSEFWNRGGRVKVEDVVWAEGTAPPPKLLKNYA